MELMQEFNSIMDENNQIALATSVDNIPNVRVVNFFYNPQNKGVLYLSSFRGVPRQLSFHKII